LLLLSILQRFDLKPKPRKFLKAVLRTAFKNFLGLGNCLNKKGQHLALTFFM